jgi:hypothetical protein
VTAGPRIRRLLATCIEEADLDLSGLTVLTEAASGPYLYTPILAALAGAERVIAVTADSRWATGAEVEARTAEASAALGVAVEVVREKTPELLGAADVVTNSGFVRPIDRGVVAHLKPTAVVSLMWETWERRDADLDVDACRERGILVLGTEESRPPAELYPYSGFIALKLLFELGLEGYRTRTLLLGSGRSLAGEIHACLGRLGLEVEWFSAGDPGSRPYEELPRFFRKQGDRFDAVIVAEHVSDVRLLGRDGLLSYEELLALNPALAVGVISGNVDADGLQESGLAYRPAEIRPFRYMSYQAADLGPRPVLELYAAGLKVGEAMARARLGGLGVEEARLHALANSPAMDFPPDW